MKADLRFATGEKGISAMIDFDGSTSEKLALCQYILSSLEVTSQEAMLIALSMKANPMKPKMKTGYSTSILLDEYLKQKGEENG